MHWIIQDNLFRERGVDDLIGFLERHQLSYSLHKVVPFVGEIQPDIEIYGPVIVYGAYSLRHIAKRKGWVPGCFDLGETTYSDFIDHWGDHMLNSDTVFCTYKDAPDHLTDEDVFIRPIHDSKHFAGCVTNKPLFMEDWHRVVVLEEDHNGSTLRGNTEIMISSFKHILKEHRLWIVDGKIVTYSLYKQGAKVVYSHEIDDGVRDFALQMLDVWQPLRAFVMDVATLDKDGEPTYKIVECNTFNAAGLYAADVFKIVEAIEDMRF